MTILGPGVEITKVVYEPLKMTILGRCVKIPPGRLKLIFTPVPANPASLRVEIYT